MVAAAAEEWGGRERFGGVMRESDWRESEQG